MTLDYLSLTIINDKPFPIKMLVKVIKIMNTIKFSYIHFISMGTSFVEIKQV